MTEEQKNQNVENSQQKEIQKPVEKAPEIIKEDREFSEKIEYIKEGYQPTDILDVSNPPSGTPPSDTGGNKNSEK